MVGGSRSTDETSQATRGRRREEKEIGMITLDKNGWPQTKCCGQKEYVPDLCPKCKAAFYAETERRLRQCPDENREYQIGYAHACGYVD